MSSVNNVSVCFSFQLSVQSSNNQLSSSASDIKIIVKIHKAVEALYFTGYTL